MDRIAGRPVIRSSHEKILRLYGFLIRWGCVPIWTIYAQNTREYPGQYVARCWKTIPRAEMTRLVMTHDTLEELRDYLPPGLVYFPRSDSDPWEIIESWI